MRTRIVGIYRGDGFLFAILRLLGQDALRSEFTWILGPSTPTEVQVDGTKENWGIRDQEARYCTYELPRSLRARMEDDRSYELGIRVICAALSVPQVF